MRLLLPDTNTRFSCSGRGPPQPTIVTPGDGEPSTSSTSPPTPIHDPHGAPYGSRTKRISSFVLVYLNGEKVGPVGFGDGVKVRVATGERVGPGVSVIAGAFDARSASRGPNGLTRKMTAKMKLASPLKPSSSDAS